MAFLPNGYKQVFRRLLISRPKLTNYLYGLKRLDFQTCFEDDEPTTILFGDSLVRLGNWTRLLGRNDVINRGFAGDTLAGMVERLDYLRAVSAKIAFIEGGINDLPTAQLDFLIKQYKQIISFWQAKGTIPVVHAVLFISPEAGKSYPWRADWAAINQQANTINKVLREFCMTHNLDFVDLNTSLSDSVQLCAEFTTDGVHLTPSAYKIWADVITQILQKHGF